MIAHVKYEITFGYSNLTGQNAAYRSRHDLKRLPERSNLWKPLFMIEFLTLEQG